MIELNHIVQQFEGQQGVFRALDEVSLNIAAGEVFGVIGRSGAGKSTLIRVINFLSPPTFGQVVVDGRCLNDLDPAQLRLARRDIGMIFQHFNLLSSRTVFDNIALPLELAKYSRQAINKRVNELLELVGLSAQRGQYPAQISGGQKQRVGIARALASGPKVLLSDEATSALDPETTRSILALLKRINAELGLTIVLITHEMEVIKQVCERVAVIDAGQVIEQGEVIDVFMRPQHEITRSMIGDLVAQSLPAGVRERIIHKLQAGNHFLYRLAFVDTDVDQPLLSTVIREFQLDFNILHGYIDEIQGQAFGSLAVMVGGGQESIQGAVQYLRGRGVVIEELPYV